MGYLYTCYTTVQLKVIITEYTLTVQYVALLWAIYTCYTTVTLTVDITEYTLTVQ